MKSRVRSVVMALVAAALRAAMISLARYLDPLVGVE